MRCSCSRLFPFRSNGVVVALGSIAMPSRLDHILREWLTVTVFIAVWKCRAIGVLKPQKQQATVLWPYEM
jgi:hypothetical protein